MNDVENWISRLNSLKDVHFQRNFTLSASPLEQTLHVFVDASQFVYATVAYIRTVYEDGLVDVQLVGSKSRLAPLHGLSIPRMELCSCLIGARLANSITTELDLKLDAITYWSDSTAALGYIRNRRTRFAVFVGNRISEIQTTTRIEDWRHCPTDMNVADGLTRGHFPSSPSDPYYVGPPFLRLPSEQWPNDLGQTYDELIDPTDIRRDLQVMFADVPIFSHVTDFFPKFSSFRRLIVAVGWLL